MMNNDHYPGLYRYADSASLRAQRAYQRFHQVYLGSLMLGSAVGAIATLSITRLSVVLYTVMALVLAVGLLILWIMRARQDDKIWFDGRAIAESVKTTTWRFMMKVPPFHEDDKADARFISQLREIREARPHLAKYIAATQVADGLSITDFMRAKRSASLEDKRAFYVSDRLADQKSWYAKKAKLNATSSTRWFWIVASLQISATILAVIQAVLKGLAINIVPAITTFAAAFAAWGQMKRYDELAQSYALAAQELEELESLARGKAAAEDFAQLIEQAENSISREHTMWCARRDVRLAGNRTH
jgi:ABC-type multidrug transport system fused ATPase/permease subunit